MTRREFVWQIETELQRAYDKHGREQWGRHEFYAILKEEFDEVWDDIKRDAPQEKLRKEIIQVAAMCLRYLETGDRYRKDEPEDFKGFDRSEGEAYIGKPAPAYLRKIMD